MKFDFEVKTDVVAVHIPMTFERRGGRKLVIAPDIAEKAEQKPKRDETLVRAIVKAHCWRRRIESGHAKSITNLTTQKKITNTYIYQLLPLTYLTP